MGRRAYRVGFGSMCSVSELRPPGIKTCRDFVASQWTKNMSR
jgi:hypothetical protein